MSAAEENPPVRGLLIDLDGVIYVGDQLIPGARETLERLDQAGLPRRFVTNTTTRPASDVVEKLRDFGIEVDPSEVFSAVTATRLFLESQGPPLPGVHLVVRESVLPEFAAFSPPDDTPRYVVIGDIGAAWSYPLMNRIFHELQDGAELIAMHKNKYFQTTGDLDLDIGAFVAGLEFVSGQRAKIIGKPSPEFFRQALHSLGLSAGEVVMIGDDLNSDVGGGQDAGMRGLLVQTGKFRPQQLEESPVRPDAILASIADLPDWLGI